MIYQGPPAPDWTDAGWLDYPAEDSETAGRRDAHERRCAELARLAEEDGPIEEREAQGR